MLCKKRESNSFELPKNGLTISATKLKKKKRT
jgi:hypothetical protein